MSESKPPCMIVVHYVLPALRVLIMKDLMEKHNLRKIDAAAKMKLSPAAITQYAKGERGAILVKEITKSCEAMRIVSEISRALVDGNMPEEAIMNRLCEACMALRSRGICSCISLKAK